MKRESGFTLLESMMALFLFGVLLSLVLPRMGASQEKKELELFAAQFTADFHWAQSLAVSKNRSYTFQLIPERHLYRVREGFGRTVKQVSYSKNWEAGSNFDSYGFHNVLFNRLGHVSGGGTYWIATPSGSRIDLVVQVATGRIEARFP